MYGGRRSTFPLAVLAANLGQVSETFVRRHIEELLPARTAVVARRVVPDAAWIPSVPTLFLTGRRARWERILGRVPTPEVALRRQRRRMARFLRRHRVEVVMIEYLDKWFPFLETLFAADVRVFAHAHGYDASVLLEDPAWRAKFKEYNRASGVITVSEDSKRRLVAIGLDEERISVVPCGIDVPEWDTRPAVRGGPIRFAALGRLVPCKGILQSIAAFAAVHREMPATVLDIVGDGPLREASAHAVHELRLAESVRLHGPLPHDAAIKILSQADVFVQHGRRDERGAIEGRGLSIMEAMARGIPVVATRHGGIPESVRDGADGILVNEGDVEAMSAAMRRLAVDPDLREAMGASARARAKAEFSADVERAKLLSVLGLDTLA